MADQIWNSFATSDKMTSILSDKRQKKGQQPRGPGEEVAFFWYRTVENSGNLKQLLDSALV